VISSPCPMGMVFVNNFFKEINVIKSKVFYFFNSFAMPLVGVRMKLPLDSYL
jgi:hypothetical protein